MPGIAPPHDNSSDSEEIIVDETIVRPKESGHFVKAQVLKIEQNLNVKNDPTAVHTTPPPASAAQSEQEVEKTVE